MIDYITDEDGWYKCRHRECNYKSENKKGVRPHEKMSHGWDTEDEVREYLEEIKDKKKDATSKSKSQTSEQRPSDSESADKNTKSTQEAKAKLLEDSPAACPGCGTNRSSITVRRYFRIYGDKVDLSAEKRQKIKKYSYVCKKCKKAY